MAAKQRLLDSGTLTIGESSDEFNFAADVTNAKLTAPDGDSESDNYLDGHSEVSEEPEWALEGSITDDFTMEGAAVWCLKHNGQKLPYTFVPNKSGGVQWKGECTIKPISVGGDVKTRNKQDFSFPSTVPTPSEYTAGS
ncbi:hypothetical protein MCC10115_0233 [Bifidobacterium longum subsp. longum]|jgi:hypothetical protein|uniref:hypothetical protein n=1 Tax=Bifidobacterium longum TaxID=216816 RepID=UPI00103AF3D0|nr:hypothetical protein [Bifidobacterium longum]TCF65975.1 hypothetical protein MCC10115_0233 [Bifidobacterium longum subsp. longum]